MDSNTFQQVNQLEIKITVVSSALEAGSSTTIIRNKIAIAITISVKRKPL